MVPAHLGYGVARRMLEQSGDDLPRLICAAEKSEARRAVAKRARDIGALAKDARRPIQDFFMIAHTKIGNRVSHTPTPARVFTAPKCRATPAKRTAGIARAVSMLACMGS